MGAPRALALCFNFGGALDFQEGNWTAAERNLRDAVALYRDVGSASGESLSLQRLGLLLTAKGEVDEAQRCLADGMVIAERAAMRSHCLTRMHASMIRNRLAAADEPGLRISLAEGREAARRHGRCVTCNALLLPETVRAEIALGDVDAAEDAAARLEATAAGFDSQAWTAMAEQAWGRVHVARGNADEARAHLTRARDAYAAAGQTYEAARCELGLAVCAGDAAQARALRRKAAATFAELGASGAEDRLLLGDDATIEAGSAE